MPQAIPDITPATGVVHPNGAIVKPITATGELFGDYILFRKLAESGVGELYQAQQRATGVAGVLKRLRPDRKDNAISQERFVFEQELGRILRHPNLVRVLDSGRVGERAFLFVEEIRGPSLRQLMQGQAAWVATRETLLQAMEQIGHGLAFAHRLGVVHCDLKPENVLFHSPKQAVIIDFGMAFRNHGQLGGSLPADAPNDFVLGTPNYMAPERLWGRPNSIAPVIDVYAFGVMLHEILTGKPPFVLDGAGDKTEQLGRLARQVESEALPPMQLDAVPAGDAWEVLCRRCLGKKPQQRPDSLEKVAADVGSILRHGKPLHGEAQGLVRRVTRWFIKS